MMICSHDHRSAAPGLDGAALTTALDHAMVRCLLINERMTAPRRRVLELLLKADRPLKAYDLINSFGAHGEPAKPPTVYRALDFLARHGFAHRLEILSAYVACRIGEEPHTATFFICKCCGDAHEIELVPPAMIYTASEAIGFHIDNLVLEALGLCSACQAR